MARTFGSHPKGHRFESCHAHHFGNALSTPKHLLICLTVAFLLRLAFIFFGFPFLETRWQLREDGDGYGQIADSIRAGQYEDVTRGPVYPAFVAALRQPIAVKVAQAVVDLLTVWCVWKLARNIWAAWLWALYPFAIWRVAFFNKETLLVFLLAGYLVLQIVAFRSGKRWQWILSGVVLGVVNLCKPMFLLWPVVLLFVFPRRAWLAALAVALVVTPWTYRNWRVTGGEFLPVATENGGITTFVGNYQPSQGLWEGPGKTQWQAAAASITGTTVVQIDRAYYRAAWEQVTGNPWRATQLALRKCWRFWFLSAKQREQFASFVIHAGYLALLGIGVWRCRRWDAEMGLMVGMIGYVMLVHALSYADLRFSITVMPYVCALAFRTSATRAAATVTS